MKHLDMTVLLALAYRGERPDHLDACSFCRDQYQLAVDFAAFTPDKGHGEEGAQVFHTVGDSRRSAYRLAAQSGSADAPVFRLRRTWYFDNNSKILRVIEDVQREVLTGFFISELGSANTPRIQFDGIDGEFIPDSNGVFEIGAAAINIEPMNVRLLPA